MSTSGEGTQTDLLKCAKCKKRKCTYAQVYWCGGRGGGGGGGGGVVVVRAL